MQHLMVSLKSLHENFEVSYRQKYIKKTFSILFTQSYRNQNQKKKKLTKGKKEKTEYTINYRQRKTLFLQIYIKQQ